ncbi:MAG: hypothetical protein ACO26F_04140 [Burkholderiaceae bacterium]|jgi:hypothetical protein
MIFRLHLIILAALFTTGCGGSDEPLVVLYKPAGSLQCNPTQTTQMRLDAEVSTLRQAGISVTASGCANDGQPRIALCGADNGDLFSVTVTTAAEASALRLGFKLPGLYPHARPMACQ